MDGRDLVSKLSQKKGGKVCSERCDLPRELVPHLMLKITWSSPGQGSHT